MAGIRRPAPGGVSDFSAYGIVNAIAHFSHDVEDYDWAAVFEALGGMPIELPASDWNEIAEEV